MFVLINLKAYDCDPVRIAEAAVAAGDTVDDVTLAVAPQTAHLDRVAATGVETWAQHVAPSGAGSHTGSQRATAAADCGAAGTLLNHSERRLRLATIDDAIGRGRAAGLRTIVCANTPDQAAAVAQLGPDAVAVEPPELIGGDVPVSEADPDVVRDAVAAVTAVDQSIDVLCGAGIASGEDVDAAANLGADGVLLASGVAKATDPHAAITDLVAAFE